MSHPFARPANGTPRVQPPDASRGGARGYAQEQRQRALVAYAAGVALPLIGVSISSILRWQQRLAPHRMSGGRAQTRFRGGDLFLLILFREAWSKATADEVRAFIATHSATHHVYSRPDITAGEQRAGYKRKRGSTTANQAFAPHQLARRHNFWNMAFPYGVVGTPRADMIDLDEAGFTLETVNRRYGKAYAGVRVRDPGPYGHRERWNLILAISPTGRRWFRFSRANTDAIVYADFVRHIVTSLPTLGSPLFVRRTFLHDNLSAHHHALVTQTITNAGHRVLPRPPYRPCDGPIEYQFNTIAGELQKRLHLIRGTQDLQQAMYDIVANLHGFDASFTHCGYQ